MTRFRWIFAAIFLIASPLMASPVGSSDFNLSSPSAVPGASLQPGSYKIEVVNRLSDRMILRVESPDGALRTTFIGIPNHDIAKPMSAGPVSWRNTANGATYIKGWYFAGTPSVVEFVYPKADALAIASSNPSKVPAVDPASEGKPADNTLSQDDMQLLTLWMLSVQQVGGSGQAPQVKAERYQTMASVSHKPVLNAIPHTASLQPVVWLAALISILIAVVLRTFGWLFAGAAMVRGNGSVKAS